MRMIVRFLLGSCSSQWSIASLPVSVSDIRRHKLVKGHVHQLAFSEPVLELILTGDARRELIVALKDNCWTLQLLFVLVPVFHPRRRTIRRRIESLPIVAHWIVLIDSQAEMSHASCPRQCRGLSVRGLDRAINPVWSEAVVVLVGMADVKVSGLQIRHLFINLAVIVAFLAWQCPEPGALNLFLKWASIGVNKIGHVVPLRHFFSFESVKVLLPNQMHVGSTGVAHIFDWIISNVKIALS